MKKTKQVLPFILIGIMTITTACSKDVNILLSPDGDVVLMSTETIQSISQDSRYSTRLALLLDQKQRFTEQYIPDEALQDLFIVFPISANKELWHKNGSSSVSGTLQIDPSPYRCSQSDFRSYTITFPRQLEVPDGLFHYNAIAYLPSFIFHIEGSRQPAPSSLSPEDICMSIDENLPNKDPYLNGHTSYGSNELRFSAAELNTLIDTVK